MGFLSRFSPDEYYACLTDIDPAGLRSRGFETILLDLDNTLLPWKSSDVPDHSREWVESARTLGMKMCILSNTHYPARLRKIAEELSIPCFHRALKPRRGGFVKASGCLGSSPERSVVVGDQVLTDILGGNLAGMHTILVQPMDHREFIGTKFSRVIEKIILALLNRRPQSGTISRPNKSDKQDSR